MKLRYIYLFALAMCACSSPAETPPSPTDKPQEKWQLAWSDDFNGNALDSTVWERSPRGTAAWNRYMSDDPSLVRVQDGNLILRAIVNPDTKNTDMPYLTGGVDTRGKKSFAPGYMEVTARLQGGRGAWPAIWMLPFEHVQWPDGGEVDIMERLNYQGAIHQTVHSHYTYALGHKDDPVSTHMTPFEPSQYNVFGAKILQDKVVFYVNGLETFTYPRVPSMEDLGQFPFFRNMCLILGMQVGGWAGEIDPADLPLEMHIDRVAYYIPAE